MSKLVAMGVAILPPPEASARAVAYSAALPAEEGSEALRLDAEHLPHVTLTQQFIREDELDMAFERIDEVLRGRTAFPVDVTGGGLSGHTMWLAVERSDEIVALHEAMMEALHGLERPGGGPGAFYEGEGRVADVMWVTGFRLKSSFGAFQPHITLGHAEQLPPIEPMRFQATTIAACHLGRFCTCRRMLRGWTLTVPAR